MDIDKNGNLSKNELENALAGLVKEMITQQINQKNDQIEMMELLADSPANTTMIDLINHLEEVQS